MASPKSLSAKNLEALGVSRLAELLIEISTGDAIAKRKLRLELAGQAGGAEVAHEVRKRLATIAKARSFIDWDKIKALAADLEAQHRAIIDHVARADPREALDLLWRFMALAESVFERCDDSNGRVSAVFGLALPDLGVLASAAKPDPKKLAERVFDALCDNGYAQYDSLIEVLAEPLGPQGLDHLKALVTAYGKQPPTPPREEDRQKIGWGSGGPIYADQIEIRQHARIVSAALRDIAEAQGDVDGFIAGYDEQARRVPAIAADIARRLLDAGRTDDAWQAIEAADHARGWMIPHEWEDARIAVLEALGRAEEAQAFRWACFERSLSPTHLRAFLKKLPDFDDVEAETRAMAHVLGHPSFLTALGFLIEWPALDRANRLVLDRHGELNGDHYEYLNRAADSLEARYPLAATLLRRAMIDFALTQARAKRYPHAARHLAECAALAGRIEDYGPHPTHDAYHQALRAAHGRKTGFWQLL